MLKIDTTKPCKRSRRGDIITLKSDDGEVLKIQVRDHSADYERLSTHRDFKRYERDGRKIYRDKYKRVWWKNEYEAHKGCCHRRYFISLEDYIIGRLFLERNTSPK